MKKINLLICVILLTLSACSTTKNKLPPWVNESGKECDKSELCAIGEGNDGEEARLRSLANLAKIFENRIETEFSTSLSSNNDEVKETSEDSIKEQTNVILEGAEIRKTHEEKGSFFAFAVISKSKLSSLIRKDMGEIDQKIKALMKEKSVGSLTKIEQLLDQRAPFERKLTFLSGASLMAPMSREQIKVEKQRRLEKIKLYFKSYGENAGDFKAALQEALTSNGFKLTESLQNDVTHRLEMRLKIEKAHLNVAGFTKENYRIKVEVVDGTGTNVSTVNFDYGESGRSREQVKEKVLDKFKNDLIERFGEFNIQ